MGDDSLMDKRRMCVNRFIVMAQALDEFHPILFWPQARHLFGAHTTHMRTAYLLLATLLLDVHTMPVRSQVPQLLRGAGVKIRSLSTPLLKFLYHDESLQLLSTADEGQARLIWLSECAGHDSISRNLLVVESVPLSLCLLEE